MVEFGLDRAEVDRMWRFLFALCVRDRATALSWHPWRLGGALSYVVKGERHWLVRPPPELDPLVLASARALLARSRAHRAIAGWLGWPVAGRFRTRGGPGASEWCGAVWSAGGVVCIDFHRLDVVIRPITEGGSPEADPLMASLT
jgi:hypothetical protein